MFDPTQMEDNDESVVVTEAERWTILIALILGCIAGAWIMAAIIDMAMEAWT